MRGKKGTSPPFPGDPADARGFHPLALAFAESQEAGGRTEATVTNYLRNLRYFAAWAIEREVTKPLEVTRPLVERYQAWVCHYRKSSGQPLAIGVQAQRLLAVQLFFRWLVRQNLALYNPAADLELPSVRRSLPKDVLSASEVEQVLAQPDLADDEGLRDRAILEVLYSTGLRRREVARLGIHDIDRERGVLMVRQGKGRKDRVVPIGERAMAWVEKYASDARSVLVRLPDPGVLFLTRRGIAMHPDVLTRLAGGYVKASGISKKGACHLFRHSMATLMLENGADVRFVQEILGHESLVTTQIYTHVSIRQLKEVHARTHPAASLDAGSSRVESGPRSE